MSDAEANDKQPDGARDDPLAGVAGGDVEGLLDRAGALASQAVDQLDSDHQTNAETGSAVQEAAAIDAELADLDGMLSQTVEAAARDVDAAEDGPPHDGAATPEATPAHEPAEDAAADRQETAAGPVAAEAPDKQQPAPAESADALEPSEPASDDESDGAADVVDDEALAAELESLLAEPDDDAPTPATDEHPEPTAPPAEASQPQPTSADAEPDAAVAEPASEDPDSGDDPDLDAQLAALEGLSESLEAEPDSEAEGVDPTTAQATAPESEAASSPDPATELMGEASEVLQAVAAEAESESGDDPADDLAADAMVVLSAIPEWMVPFAATPVRGLLRALYLMDRPLAWLGPGARRAIGCIAVATLLVAVGAIIVSIVR